ncbi:MAG: ABC transporter substrate-binding protein, partial [Cyanobacteria bacterium J06636_16]
AIVGPQASRNAIPAASVAETSQVPLISPWSTNPATTENKRYAFRVPYTDPLSAAVMARFAHADLEAKKAAILYDSEQSHNSTSADVFAKTFKELGGTVVATEAYTTDTLDFEAHLMRIRGQEPQVLYLPNYANEVPLQAQQARELGIEATLLGSDAWGTMSEGQLSEDLEGSFFSSHFAADNVAPEARTFVTRYQERYNRLPDDVAALTYDAFGLLFRAIQSQEEIGTEAIRNGLFSVSDYRGVTGVIAYEQSGDPTKSVVVMKIQNERFKFDQLSAPQ